MSDHPVARGARPGDRNLRLRLAALTAVIIGVILVALAAFLFSYTGIHQIALQAGVSPGLARLYPLMFDAMLIITCSAVLATRTAGWGTKSYVWVCLLLVVAAVAVGDALYATGVHLTGQAARATIAVIPWVLLLLGFGIWLVMLRHWRRVRAGAVYGAEAGPGAPAAPNGRAGRGAPAVAAGAAAGGAVSWAADRGAAAARTRAPRPEIDSLLLEQQAGRAPERPRAAESPAAANRPAAAGQGRQRPATQDERQPAGTTTAAAGAAAAAGIAAGTQPGTPAESKPGTTKETKPGTTAGTAAATPGAAAGTTRGTAAATPGTAGTTPGAADTTPGTPTATPGAADTTPATPGAAAATPGISDTVAGADARAGTGATSAADPAETGRDRGGQDQAAQERRRRPGGLLEMPASADDDVGSVRILPAGPKATAGDAAASEDDQAGTPAAAAEPDPANPPAPLPHFDRPRSTPTPPQETGADGE
jgi:hypothetical protein